MKKKLLSIATVFVGLAAYFGVGRGREERASESYRVVIAGFDGMDPEFLDYFLSQGKLPNFQKLMREGAYAPCQTFKPTKSVVLWTSVATGKRMEKHGIVDWHLLSTDGRKILASGQSRRTEALWNMASRTGKSSSIVNWWATWPAEAVQGEIVSNHFPRSLHEPLEEATFPPELASELEALGLPDRASAEEALRAAGIPVYSRELAGSVFRPN
ncbi:MAG: alkaline phosphatase family protein, partial [Vicinamibacteria bacterium]